MALGPAQIGFSPPHPPPSDSPSKGQGAGSSLLSDETSTRGSLSLMKGSLCGAGRPLAKDKNSVCPPSLARDWGLPLGWLMGWGWAQVRSVLPFSIFPVSITELLSLLGRPPGPALSAGCPQPPSGGGEPQAWATGPACGWQGSSELSNPGGIQADTGLRARDAGQGLCLEGSQHSPVLCARQPRLWLARSVTEDTEAPGRSSHIPPPEQVASEHK